jgi:uncharacterized protein (TIGR03790 family)
VTGLRKLLPLTLALAAAGAARAQLAPSQLALIVNDDEPNSVAVGEDYRKLRSVPAANVIHVRIPGSPRKLDADTFARLKSDIDARLPSGVQAVLFVWTAPYAVECNGITSAYTLGFDASQCDKPCGPGRRNPVFNALPGLAPVRLSMLLPTTSVELSRAVIERGMAAGFSMPKAGAYYLRTSEAARNSRAAFFPHEGVVPPRRLTIHNLKQDTLENASDVMIYQTGKARVDKLDTLKFLPGALADHLTSFGGDLLADHQMSSLRWLEAGATASYGTVSEPCNHWQKFPHPDILLRAYLRGSSAIEAYWRSVAWPAQGLFIGEPLAAPYRGYAPPAAAK